MIEKLDSKMEYVKISIAGNEEAECLDFAAGRKLNSKINELCDVVNELQLTVSKMENLEHLKKIGQGFKKLNNPYEEQRKWIGCLVEYGNADDGFRYGILTNIEPRYSAYPFEIDNGRDATADCWLPSKTIFYKGE